MIYKFRMISSEDRAFLRDFEVDANQTFLTFHEAIQGNLNFDPSQLVSFFLADEHWNKGMELTLIDMQNEGDMAAIPMDSATVGELIKNRKERLLYVFDIYTDRSLFIELLDIYEPTPGVTYPICTAAVGDPPLQFAGGDIENFSPELTDDAGFEDFSNEFDSDEAGSDSIDD